MKLPGLVCEEQVKQEGSGIRTSHADVFHVAAGQEEFVLVFGRRFSDAGSAGEESLAFNERIVLNPFAGKRLAMQLQNVLRAHEQAYGAPGRESAGIADPRARRLLDLVGDLGRIYGLERSFKIFEHTLLENRFLVTMASKSSTDDKYQADRSLLDLCERIRMPADFMDLYREYLPFAKFVHFGFEENELSAIYKAYLEFSEDSEPDIQQKPSASCSFPLYLGFKWDVSAREKRALTKYTCHPRISPEEMLERISGILEGSRGNGCLEITRKILESALARTGKEEILFIEASEEGNPRKSFDINMYRAELRLEELYPLFLRMCRHFSIPEKRFDDIYDPTRSKRFGHLSGGIDREGKDFLTVYYGAEGYPPAVRLPASDGV